ncbi:MAG: hypothetical protein ABIP30_17410 [Ferruginibacter sp.]
MLFIYLNYKWGITATPIHQFGMFSSVMKETDTQTIYHIYADDHLVDMSNVYFSKRDLLLNSIAFYKIQQQHNTSVFNILDPLFSKVKFPTWDINNFSNDITDDQFLTWFKKRVSVFLGYRVQKIEIFSQKYLWAKEGFAPVSTAQKEFIAINR